MSVFCFLMIRRPPRSTLSSSSAASECIRDRCISCGKYEHEISHSGGGGLWDCGHYRSVGSAPELRFEPLNAHKQCKKCNQFLSGNHVEYRFGLARRLSSDQLEWLEGPHKPKRYKVDELKELHAHFKGLNRIMERRETKQCLDCGLEHKQDMCEHCYK